MDDLAVIMTAVGVGGALVASFVGVRQARHLRKLTHDDSLFLRVFSLDFSRRYKAP